MKLIHSSGIFSNFPSRKNFFFWIVIALLFKGGFFFYKIFIEDQIIPNEHFTETFAIEGGDSFSYFEAVEAIDDINQYDVPLNFCITPQKLYEF